MKGQRGSEHHEGKGDAASPTSKRMRAERLYAEMGLCERCSKKPAYDRHHEDGDTGNNERSNSEFLCRRCHQNTDGRIDNLQRHAYRVPARGERPCINCRATIPHHVAGRRCSTCKSYYYAHDKTERPVDSSGVIPSALRKKRDPATHNTRAGVAAMQESNRTRYALGCRRGHPWTEESTVYQKRPGGRTQRVCRICRQLTARRTNDDAT